MNRENKPTLNSSSLEKENVKQIRRTHKFTSTSNSRKNNPGCQPYFIQPSEENLPYPGLRPYTEEEKTKFFGRDVDTEILIDKILTNRLTLLFAASGVGKSSLLQAAVIPHLRSKTGENLTVVYHIDWVSDPVMSLYDAVLQTLRTKELLSEDSGENDFGEKLPDLLAFCSVFARPPLVLILDQFEEFFRYQRHQTGFRTFIDQLTTVITDKSLPVHLVLSMREDFALELNAFKPKLPTILFENFHRLEKLGRQAVHDAIIIPAEQRGFIYEPELLEKLLTDLLSREMDRQPNSPIGELLETVEPPYLQIVCAQLWNLNKNDLEQTLRLTSYEKAGRAKGILKNYLDEVLQKFSFAEKQLASQAFDHLVSLRGVKMAYTAQGLAELLRVDEKELAKVLERLEKIAVLRRQQRQDELWYELYHDMFSGSIEDWNNAWKDRMRRRRAAKITGGVVLATLSTIAAWDYYQNITNYHFRLNPSVENAQVELWQGKPNSWNFFGLQQYKSEAATTRQKLEPDKRFDRRLIEDYMNLQLVLQGYKPAEERITAYASIGDFAMALKSAESQLLSRRTLSAKRSLPYLAAVRTKEAAQLMYHVFQHSNSSSIRKAISGNSYTLQSNIISPATGVSLTAGQPGTLIDEKTPEEERAFWLNILATQISTHLANEQIENLSKQTNNSFSVNKVLVNHPDSRTSKIWALELLESAKSSNFHSAVMQTLGTLSARKTIPLLIEQLSSSSSSHRSIAARALGQLQAESAIPELTQLINNNDEDAGVRISAIKALTHLNTRKITPTLTKLLLHRNTSIGAAAAEALGQFRVEVAVPDLLKLLHKSEPYNIRAAAITALGQIRNETVIPQLVNILLTGSYYEAAAKSLANFKSEDVITEVLKHPKMKYPKVLSRELKLLMQGLDLQQRMIPEFKTLLKDEKFNRRIFAVLALQKLRVKNAVPELIPLLQDSTVNLVVIEALVDFGVKQEKVVSELLNLLNTSGSSRRKATVIALGRLKAKQASEELITRLRDDDNASVRALAGKALADIGARQAITELLPLLEDENPTIRDAAAEALGQLKSKQAVSQLEKLLRYDGENDYSNDGTLSAAALGLSLAQANEVIPALMNNLANQIGSSGGRNLSAMRVKALTYWQHPHLLPHLFPVMSDVIYQKDNNLPNLESASRIASGGLLDFLLVRLKNINEETRISATIAALRMLSSNNLDKIQKLLLHKALNRVEQKIRNTAQKQLEAEEAEEKAKMLGLPVNQPGLEEKPLSLSELKENLSQMNHDYASWRKRRDADQPSITKTEDQSTEETEIEADNLTDPAPFIYEYAYAIAHESESEGIKLLGHNLYKVREAAARGLANGDALGVELLKKLEKAWLETKDPIERQGIYHAIDIALLAIEGVGYKKELADLKAYEPTLTNDRSAASIKPRVEWTRIQLQWRVDANKELEELAARQLPKLLKEYCLNEDGTDMKPEECTIEQ